MEYLEEASNYGWIGLIVAILEIVAVWKMFEKAGVAGWKSIIPIYNAVVMMKIIGLSPLLLLLFFLIPIPIVGLIAVLYVVIKICTHTASAYGQESIFAVLVFFFPGIAHLILGFGSAEYVASSGPRATHSSISDKINQSYDE